MIGIIKSEAVLLFRQYITPKFRALRGLSSLGEIRNDNETNTDRTGEETLADNGKEKKNRKRKPSINLEKIYEYFKHTDLRERANRYPSRIITQRKSKPDSLYLFDPNVAQDMADLIKDDLMSTDSDNTVVEMNSGIGLLAEKLLLSGIPMIRTMEPNEKFRNVLENLKIIYQDRVIIGNTDLLHVWNIVHQDRMDGGNRLAAVFSQIPQIPWGEKIGLSIIGTVTNIHLIKYIMMDIIRQHGLVSFGRPVLYITMPPSTWLRLTCTNKAGKAEYRSVTVLFQLLFEYKLLTEIPRRAFLPWLPDYVPQSSAAANKKTIMDNDYLYLIKIEGRKNLFTDIIDPKQLQPLWYFMCHHLTARSSRIIPQMESWEPGCGVTLIMRGMSIFTQFGDLSPQELLELFKLFTSWEGYHNSFIPSLENSMEKIEQLLF